VCGSALKRRADARGAALIDLIFTCGLLAVMAAIAIPSVQASRDRDAAVMAARHLAQQLVALRVEAIRRNRSIAMRFDADDLGRIASYVDGDGDGVLEHDIARGIDVRVGQDGHVEHYFAMVSVAVPVSIPAPDGHGTIAAHSDPVRIGNSNLLSFTPLGSSTSGTIYLAGHAGTQACVRVFGATGRVRVLVFDRASGAWRHD
jgi:hypothetical protein